MSNEEQYIITVRFAKTGATSTKSFGVKYLITTPIIWPELDDNDEPVDPAWSPDDEIKNHFYKQYEQRIGKTFDGEILFIESSNLVLLGAKN